ncbi:MAG: alpha/beta hydrolase [Planctomycetota bacterium]
MEPEIRLFKTTPQGPLRAHIFAPASGRARCAVVFFVCGAWDHFHAPRHYPRSVYFRSRGALAVVAEVRTVAHHGTTAGECVIDGKSAVRWVRRQAGAFGVPADRVVTYGGSAAGHVALCTAMIEGAEDPADDRTVSGAPNLVGAANPGVLPEVGPHNRDHPRVRARLEKFADVAQHNALSPLRAVRSGLPPVLMLHGDSDTITPLADSQRFADAMTAAGNECRLIVYPGEQHGFSAYNDRSPRFVDTVRELDRFLVEHGFLIGEPTIDTFTCSGQT